MNTSQIQVKRPDIRFKGFLRLGIAEAATYVLVALICILVIAAVMDLKSADLHVPLDYSGMGDFPVSMSGIKSTVENGTYRENCNLGAPGCQYHYDFPVADVFHYHAVALLAGIVGSMFLAVNLYFLAGPVVAALIALFVLRRSGIGRLTAGAMALLYAWLPSYFLRGMSHFSLALYALCPFCLLFCRQILDPEENRALVSRPGGRFHWRYLELALGVAVCSLIAYTNIYYSFFFGSLFLASGCISVFRRFDWSAAITCAVLTGTLLVGLGVNLFPNNEFSVKYGKNSEAVIRQFSGAEIYGLKITQMLLPTNEHRVGALAKLSARYDSGAPLVNENAFASLGMVGSAGFLLLLGWVMIRPRSAGPMGALLSDASTLNIVAVLLATIGGFGSLVSFLFTDAIRGYNRISPIIAFFSLAAIAAVLDQWGRRCRATWQKLLFGVTLACVTGWGLYDQIPVTVQPFWPPTQTLAQYYSQNARMYANDREFISKVETLMPKGAMIFQAPYHAYPEAGQAFGMLDYDQYTPYLLSSHLHWSYGAIKGRWEALWNQQVEKLPPAQMMTMLSEAGFSGIEVYRPGYGDSGTAFEAPLRSFLGPAVISSGDNRFAFYDLLPYAKSLQNQFKPAEWSQVAQASTSGVFLGPGDGAGSLESDAVHNWRWCAQNCSMVFSNRLNSAHRVEVEIDLAAQPSNVWVEYPGGKENLKASPNGVKFHQSVLVPPGRSTMTVSTDAAPWPNHAGDPRILVLRLTDLRMYDAAWEGAASVDRRNNSSVPEGNRKLAWHWIAETHNSITLTNPSREPVSAMISAAVSTGRPGSNLKISGLINETIRINSKDQQWMRRVVVAPGENTLLFSDGGDSKHEISAPNAGFENGGLEPWAPWQSVHLALDSRHTHSGKFSLAESAASGSVYRDLKGLEPGVPYSVSAWVSGSPDATATAQITVFDPGISVQTLSSAISPNSNWQLLEVGFKVSAKSPEGLVRFHLFRNEGNGTIFWDDFRVTGAGGPISAFDVIPLSPGDSFSLVQ